MAYFKVMHTSIMLPTLKELHILYYFCNKYLHTVCVGQT